VRGKGGKVKKERGAMQACPLLVGRMGTDERKKTRL
jgi:hypothetical protein